MRAEKFTSPCFCFALFFVKVQSPPPRAPIFIWLFDEMRLLIQKEEGHARRPVFGGDGVGLGGDLQQHPPQDQPQGDYLPRPAPVQAESGARVSGLCVFFFRYIELWVGPVEWPIVKFASCGVRVGRVCCIFLMFLPIVLVYLAYIAWYTLTLVVVTSFCTRYRSPNVGNINGTSVRLTDGAVGTQCFRFVVRWYRCRWAVIAVVMTVAVDMLLLEDGIAGRAGMGSGVSVRRCAVLRCAMCMQNARVLCLFAPSTPPLQPRTPPPSPTHPIPIR